MYIFPRAKASWTRTKSVTVYHGRMPWRAGERGLEEFEPNMFPRSRGGDMSLSSTIQGCM
jgi:hypothetical protein